MRFGINVFVFLLVVLFGNVASAGVNLPLEKNMKCQNKSHDYIKGYKIDEVKDKTTAFPNGMTATDYGEAIISIFLCDNAIVKPDRIDMSSIRLPRISKDKKTIGWVTSVLYPEDDKLNLYKDGEIYIIKPDKPDNYNSPAFGIIGDWSFSGNNNVIIEIGYLDSNEKYNIDEYNIKTGKKIRHIQDWSGE